MSPWHQKPQNWETHNTQYRSRCNPASRLAKRRATKGDFWRPASTRLTSRLIWRHYHGSKVAGFRSPYAVLAPRSLDAVCHLSLMPVEYAPLRNTKHVFMTSSHLALIERQMESSNDMSLTHGFRGRRPSQFMSLSVARLRHIISRRSISETIRS